MNPEQFTRQPVVQDELQRALDAIEGYMFFGLKREALRERWALQDTYYDDPRMQRASAAVLEVEDWIVRFFAASMQVRATGHISPEFDAITAEMEPSKPSAFEP